MPSRRIATHPDLPLPVLLCPIRSARRMRLRLDDRDGLLKVTHPRSVRPSAALAWAASQKSWVEEQIGSGLPLEPLLPGTTIPLNGQEVELVWEEGRARNACLEDRQLRCGGSREGFPRRVEAFLKRQAIAILSEETAEIAGLAGVRPSSVRIGDAKTRWGSCSSKRSLRYSWRLILAPPQVRRFVVAHEVAHLKHLNHGREFKALEQELFGGDVRAAEALLRKWAPRLRRIGVAA